MTKMKNATDLQMALHLVVGQAVHLHQLSDLLRRRHCDPRNLLLETRHVNDQESSDDYTMGSTEPLEGMQEEAVELRRPATPRLPMNRRLLLLLLHLTSSAAITTTTARGEVRSCRCCSRWCRGMFLSLERLECAASLLQTHGHRLLRRFL